MTVRGLVVRTALLALFVAPAAAGDEAPPELEDNYAVFVASEAKRVSAEGAKDARRLLPRCLAIEDMLPASRGQVWPVSVSTRTARSGYLEEHLRFQGPRGDLEAILLRPAVGRKRSPAVMIVHGTGTDPGALIEPWGAELTRKGFVVLLPRLRNSRDTGREFNDAFNLLLLDRTLAGLRVVELAKAFDFLAADDSVDPKRIGLLGQGSGSLLSVFLAVVEERVNGLVVDSSLRPDFYYDYSSALLIPGLYGLTAGGGLRDALASRPLLVHRVGSTGSDAVFDWFADVLGRGEPGRKNAAPPDYAKTLVDRTFTMYKGLLPSDSRDVIHYQAAMGHLKQGRTPEAIRELESSLEADPTNVVTLQRLIGLYDVTGQTDLAEAGYGKLLALSDNEKTRMDMGESYRRWLMPEKAREQYTEVLRINPDSAAAHRALAEDCRDRGDRACEEVHRLSVLQANPSDTVARQGMIDHYLVHGLPDRALRQYLDWLRSNPTDVWVRSTLAQFYSDHDQPGKAEEEYRRTLQIDPLNASACAGLSGLLHERGDVRGARERYEAFLKIRPRDRLVGSRLAKLCEDAGDIECAEREYRALFSAYPGDHGAGMGLGRVLESTRRHGEAVELYLSLLAGEPLNHATRMALASLYERTGAWEKARDQYQEVLKNAARRAAAHEALAGLYVGREEWGPAEEHLVAACRSDPMDGRKNRRLADFYVDRGLLDKAEALCRRFLRANPDDGMTRLSLARLCAKQGRPVEAKEEFERLLARDPQNRGAREGLASLRQGR